MMDELAELEKEQKVESSTAKIGVWDELGLNFGQTPEKEVQID
jgi:hypothetical protein